MICIFRSETKTKTNSKNLQNFALIQYNQTRARIGNGALILSLNTNKTNNIYEIWIGITYTPPPLCTSPNLNLKNGKYWTRRHHIAQSKNAQMNADAWFLEIFSGNRFQFCSFFVVLLCSVICLFVVLAFVALISHI